MSISYLMNAWLVRALGRKLLSVNALLHVFESYRGSIPQEVSLRFEDLESGRLYCGSDGVSLCFSEAPIAECDLGEYGKLIDFCVSSGSYFFDVVGLRLLSVSAIKSSVECKVIGVLLLFEYDSFLSILNLGDELFFCDRVPDEIIASEGLTFVLLGGKGGEENGVRP
ncbi:hypothetical protein cym2001_25010 [Pseudomonas sp. CYM-20-01]|jgi:hypothetical protein|uniref:hypothetical protein n=1 Tax=Pseudomonas sp. CYM-20-01 TaxID=2870750 RepID=UPI0020521FF2|nr:hypothetical protein [Pseudomonas sp. CYM-20-01]BDB19136.1 hypothetical protein cym2001_25010 [Pseudomonas sp. CYM-20-01]